MNNEEYWRRRDALFHPEMQCCVRALQYDFEHRRAVVLLEENSCTDMTGCVNTVKKLDPRVQEIRTYAGDKPDTAYRLIEGEWRAVRPLRVVVSC